MAGRDFEILRKALRDEATAVNAVPSSRRPNEREELANKVLGAEISLFSQKNTAKFFRKTRVDHLSLVHTSWDCSSPDIFGRVVAKFLENPLTDAHLGIKVNADGSSTLDPQGFLHLVLYTSGHFGSPKIPEDRKDNGQAKFHRFLHAIQHLRVLDMDKASQIVSHLKAGLMIQIQSSNKDVQDAGIENLTQLLGFPEMLDGEFLTAFFKECPNKDEVQKQVFQSLLNSATTDEIVTLLNTTQIGERRREQLRYIDWLAINDEETLVLLTSGYIYEHGQDFIDVLCPEINFPLVYQRLLAEKGDDALDPANYNRFFLDRDPVLYTQHEIFVSYLLQNRPDDLAEETRCLIKQGALHFQKYPNKELDGKTFQAQLSAPEVQLWLLENDLFPVIPDLELEEQHQKFLAMQADTENPNRLAIIGCYLEHYGPMLDESDFKTFIEMARSQEPIDKVMIDYYMDYLEAEDRLDSFLTNQYGLEDKAVIQADTLLDVSPHGALEEQIEQHRQEQDPLGSDAQIIESLASNSRPTGFGSVNAAITRSKPSLSSVETDEPFQAIAAQRAEYKADQFTSDNPDHEIKDDLDAGDLSAEPDWVEAIIHPDLSNEPNWILELENPISLVMSAQIAYLQEEIQEAEQIYQVAIEEAPSAEELAALHQENQALQATAANLQQMVTVATELLAAFPGVEIPDWPMAADLSSSNQPVLGF